MMTADVGEWLVQPNLDGTGIVLTFNHIGDEGVETFVTAIDPSNAIYFAQCVYALAQAMLEPGTEEKTI